MAVQFTRSCVILVQPVELSMLPVKLPFHYAFIKQPLKLKIIGGHWPLVSVLL